MSRAKTHCIALVFLFAFCQVVGVMCAAPNISLAEEGTMLAEEVMACPMEGSLMCPPSLTSSPDREIKNRGIMLSDQPVILVLPMAFEAVLHTIEGLSGTSSSPPVARPLAVAFPILRI